MRENMQQLRLGDILVSGSIITQEQLEVALEYHNEKMVRLGEAIVELGFVSEEILLTKLAEQMGYVLVTSISELHTDLEVMNKFPLDVFGAELFIPLRYDTLTHTLQIVVYDMYNSNIRLICEKAYGYDVNLDISLCTKSIIEQFIDNYNISRTKAILSERAAADQYIELINVNSTTETSNTRRILNKFILNGVRQRASDIRIKPTALGSELQYRIDGIMMPDNVFNTLDHEGTRKITRSLKNMANMVVLERNKPIDGSFSVIADGLNIDIRVSSLPSEHGESIVMRLLDSRIVENSTLLDLGFSEYNLSRYKLMAQNPNGIIYVTGPTGSGKSTLLQVALNMYDKKKKAIHTIEDPVEYKRANIVSTQVNERINFTFSAALKAILRQDPDIVLVGETRDAETAAVALEAANTGKLIFSTIHTNDALSIITRLKDLGVESYKIESGLLGAVSQKLVRVLCPSCKEEYDYLVTENGEKEIGVEAGTVLKLYKPKGCISCKGQGYLGRTAIHEVFIVTDEIRREIAKGTNIDLVAIKNIARSQGYITMREDGIEKVKTGITTLDEVLQATRGGDYE